MPPKSLQLLVFLGRQTPIMNKCPKTDARIHAPKRFCKTPVNCPHCGQLWSPITPEAAPGLYPASSFVLQTPAKNGEKPLESLGWGWDSTQPGRVAHSGTQGRTRGIHALCPSPAGTNWMPSFSAFAFAFCCATARSAFANCRS